MSNTPGATSGIGIFPNITIHESENTGVSKYVIETYVRKKHTDGKWYLNHVVAMSEGNGREDRNNAIQIFIRECYMYLIVGKINLDLYVPVLPGVPVFKIDDCQLEEEDRLWEQYAVRNLEKSISNG